MTKHLRLGWVILGLGGMILVQGQGCSNVGFNSGSASSSSSDGSNSAAGVGGNGSNTTTNAHSCTTQLHQITTPIKLLFVLDTSGSNTGTGGTDVNKVVRGATVAQFFADYNTKANFNWGMVAFSNDAAPALINSGNISNPIFTASNSVMQSAIATFAAMPDTGDTPYAIALQKIHQAIVNDSSTDATTKYIVVFASDGQPNPTYTGGDSQLDADVAAILSLKPGQVSINTIYYGPTNAGASGRLSNMAKSGAGQFLDTNANPTGKDFLIDNVVNVPGVVCTN